MSNHDHDHQHHDHHHDHHQDHQHDHPPHPQVAIKTMKRKYHSWSEVMDLREVGHVFLLLLLFFFVISVAYMIYDMSICDISDLWLCMICPSNHQII